MRSRSIALVALLLIARPAFAQKAGEGEKEIARVGSHVVFSDFALDKERAEAILDRVRMAYDFVAKEQRWAGDAALGHGVGVHVLSAERMKTISKTAKGVARGRDNFMITATFLDEERSDRTLAHELTHLQDRRHLVAKGARLPHWWDEGRAIAMGLAYEEKLRIKDPRYLDGIAKVASSVTVAEARKILEDDAYIPEKEMPSVFRMEAVGFYFLEFVRVERQLAREDFEPRLAKVVVRVGKGEKLEEACEAELGVGLEALRDAFYAHLERTQGKRERLKGTSLER